MLAKSKSPTLRAVGESGIYWKISSFVGPVGHFYSSFILYAAVPNPLRLFLTNLLKSAITCCLLLVYSLSSKFFLSVSFFAEFLAEI